MRGDHAFEIAVIERMIFDLDGQALDPGVEARAFRHRPALEHAIHLQAKIVMEPPCGVFLHDEAERMSRLFAPAAARLRRFGEIALAAVLRQWIGHAKGLRPGSRDDSAGSTA